MTEMAVRPGERATHAGAMAPVAYRVLSTVTETADSVTLCLEPVADSIRTPLPGEFNMLYKGLI